MAYERLKEGVKFAHLLTKPGYSVSQDLFFAETDGTVVSFISVIPELGISRVVLEYGAEPLQDLKSLLTALMEPALKRARQLGASLAHLGIPALEMGPVTVIQGLGFKPVRWFCDLQLNISETDLEGADRLDWTYRYFEDSDMQLLSDIQNRCFAGEWGYNPNTVKDTAWQLKVRNNCPQDVILALDNGEVIGYCWTESECGIDIGTGVPKGRVYMLGVDKRYRGRGLGKQLIRAGLLHLKNQGRELIEITVDTQNTVAIAIYESLGFKLCRETVFYEKDLR